VGLAELAVGVVAVVEALATVSQLVRKTGSKTRDNFMINSL
jgi:hypothetical protein